MVNSWNGIEVWSTINFPIEYQQKEKKEKEKSSAFYVTSVWSAQCVGYTYLIWITKTIKYVNL